MNSKDRIGRLAAMLTLLGVARALAQTPPPAPADGSSLFFSPSAFINRPLTHWGLAVDTNATQVLRNWMSQSPYRKPAFFTNVQPVYWVRNGDADIGEFTVKIVSSGASWQCGIPGTPATVRIPRYARPKGGPTDTTDHDRFITVVDVDRNRVYGFYSWGAASWGISPTSSTTWLASYAACDTLRGDDAAIAAVEQARWSCTQGRGCGVAGIGSGITTTTRITDMGTSISGLPMPQDFSRSQGDLGHAIGCALPRVMSNGYSWPALGRGDNNPTSGNRMVVGALIRLDPTWTIPAGVPAWEARLLRTFQRYGCYNIDSSQEGTLNGTFAIRAQAKWAGLNGTNPWDGLIPDSDYFRQAPPNDKTYAFLTHFPIDRMQVMMPNSAVFGSLNFPSAGSVAMNDRIQSTSSIEVRQAASMTSSLIGTRPPGGRGIIVGGPTFAGGFWWWHVRYDNGSSGWSIENLLTRAASQSPKQPQPPINLRVR